MLLGDNQALQTQLLGHHRPGFGVVAVLGLHEFADGGLRGVVVQELAHELAQLVLFLAEGEVHLRSPRLGPG